MPDAESASPNKKILDEVNATCNWIHAKKVRPIWAKEATEDQVVRTREGEEAMSAGDFLCRGEAFDVWPQTSKQLHSKYDSAGEFDEHGWCKYLPKPDDDGVMAAQVPHAFVVQADWGEMRGEAGDFLVKRFGDASEAYPDDVWIVGEELFASTYQAVRPT